MHAHVKKKGVFIKHFNQMSTDLVAGCHGLHQYTIKIAYYALFISLNSQGIGFRVANYECYECDECKTFSVMEFYNSYSNICKTLRIHQCRNSDPITKVVAVIVLAHLTVGSCSCTFTGILGGGQRLMIINESNFKHYS